MTVAAHSPERPFRRAEPLYSGIVPVDPPRASASGPAPYLVLALGGDLLAGHGVLRHDLGLTGGLARALARLTGFGVDVESEIGHAMTPESCKRLLLDRDLTRFDAVVLLLEPGRRRIDPEELGSHTRLVLEALVHRLPPTAAVTVVLAPVADPQNGGAFGTAVRAGAQGLAAVVQLLDPAAPGAPAQQYAAWGETIADAVGSTLAEPLALEGRADPLDEQERSIAVRDLGPIDDAWDAGFRRIVSIARDAYGARCGSVSIIDGAVARYRARQGFDTDEVAREGTICDLALRVHGGIIVGDAQADERFRDFPLVRSNEARFYAGYRLEDPTGVPVGTLCVFDPEPRPVLSQDLTLLRDLAHAAQRRIWDLAEARRRP